MGRKLREILLSEAKKTKKTKKTKKKSSNESKKGKMLKKLHELDDTIENFIDSLEDKINAVEDNPIFIKKAHQLLADMSKEYSEFMMAIRAVVNAVDRKGQVLPQINRFESKVRDINANAGDEPLPEEEPPPEEEAEDEFVIAKKEKKSGIKEALEI